MRFGPWEHLRDRGLAWLLRDRVSAGLARTDVRFYVYDPKTDLLAGITSWNWVIKSLLAGDPKPPGVLDCHWYPFLHRMPHRGGVVFDVGGYRGYTAAWFAQEAQRVYCFEANPTNQDQIADLARVRRLGNMELIRCAVSDRPGRAMLHVKPFGGHHALADIGASATIGTVEVPVITLDDFAAERGIDSIALLKIDVEGFEPDVMRGANKLFARRAIAGVLFEWSPRFYKQRGIDAETPIRILEEYGYRVETFSGRDLLESGFLERDDQRDLFAYPIQEK